MKNSTNSIMRQADQKGLKSKVGRNDPCPCSSGKKYKKCCLTNDNDSLPINRSIPCSDILQLEHFHDEQNSWLDQELSNRNSTEVAYDDVVLACLRNGNSIEKSLQAANAKYPAEALQLNENNLTDIRDHYEYLLNYLIIKEKFKVNGKSYR